MNLGGNLDVNLGGKTHNLVTILTVTVHCVVHVNCYVCDKRRLQLVTLEKFYHCELVVCYCIFVLYNCVSLYVPGWSKKSDNPVLILR